MTEAGGKASCLHCRAAIQPADAYCDRCGRSTRVDVRVHAPVEDPRRRYELAKEIVGRYRANVGGFAALCTVLEEGRGAVAESLLPVDGQPMVELLQAHGVACGLVTAGRGGRRGGRGLLLLLVGVASVLAAMVGGLLAGGVLQRLVRFPGLAASADAPSARLLDAAVEVAAPPAAPSAGPTSADTPQSSAATQEQAPSEEPSQDDGPSEALLAHIVDATVAVQCGEKRGLAFYVSRFELLTSAYLACARQVQTRSSEGLRDRAEVEWRDARLGLALLRAHRSARRWLPVQASPELELGQQGWAATTPSVGNITAIEVMVSRLDRRLSGHTFIQLDGRLTPDAAGAPLVRRDGTVAGVIAGGLPDATGIALAWPLTGYEAAASARAAFDRCGFGVARTRGQNFFATLVCRGRDRPPPAFIPLDVTYADGHACALEARATSPWLEARRQDLVTASSRARFRALLSTGELITTPLSVDLGPCGRTDAPVSVSVSGSRGTSLADPGPFVRLTGSNSRGR